MKENKEKAAGQHRKEKKRWLLLCLFLCISSFLFCTYAANAAEQKEAGIYQEGRKISTLLLLQSEKAEVTAVSGLTSGAIDWQWQVLAEPGTDQWVDVEGSGSETLTVSYAVLYGVLDSSGTASIRATASSGTAEWQSDPLMVTICPEQDSAVAIALHEAAESPERGTIPSAAGMTMVMINYLDAETGQPIYTSFSAQIRKDTEYIEMVDSPVYLGYRSYYHPEHPEELNPDLCTASAEKIEIYIPKDYEEDSYIINVYYRAVKVSYAVKYYFQNIADDFYTEDASLYRTGRAETGTKITDEELAVEREGFTKLYHYPHTVSGDGSTVFECYYDRIYSMLQFNLNGGHGVNAVYARYGAPVFVQTPERPGYLFKGWQLMDESGQYGEALAEVPETVPAAGRTYQAVWEPIDSSYAVVYWLQDADTEEYHYLGTETRTADTEEVIAAADMLREDMPICGQRGARNTHVHTSGCYVSGFEHYLYDQEKTAEVNPTITVSGDGSSVLNLYYTRKYYTLRFVYAKEYEPEYDVEHKNQYVNAKGFSIVGGSTYGFGNQKAFRYWPGGSGGDYTLTELMQSLKKYDNADKWGKVTALPQLKNGQYETGVYPAAGEGYDGSDYDYYGDRYYYFDLTARYGADLSALWPVDVFEEIQVPMHFSNGANNYCGEGEWGNYAYLAGWNGEFKINYSLQKDNSTIKGLYQKLDEGILFGTVEAGTEGTKQLSYTGDTKTQREIRAKATASGEEVTSYLNYYLAFFNNGADFGWNIPRQWIYEYYVPTLEGDLSAEEEAQLKEAKTPLVLEDGQTYYYYELNDIIYHLSAKIVTSDDNRTASSQTQSMLSGFDFAADTGSNLTDSCARAEKVENGILEDKRESYTLRLFYARKTYSFGMYNYNSYYKNEKSVPFKTVLDKYVLDGQIPDYPGGLENGAYTFAGWYSSPDCYEGTEYEPGTKMPAGNKDLYAKWVENVYTVKLFEDYDSMQAYENGNTQISPLETREVLHGDVFGNVSNPVKEYFSFRGWFYMKNGQKTAYTPSEIAVKSDLHVYAEWDSDAIQPYRIYYALEEKESDAVWLDVLQKAAGAAPQDQRAYTVAADGESRIYIYLKEDGGYHLQIAEPTMGYAYQGNMRTFHPKAGNPMNQLYEGYNQGYYPTKSSCSLAIAYEEDEDNLIHNCVTFTYVPVSEVDYRIEYRYLTDNGLILQEGLGATGNGIAQKSTSLNVVTERFALVEDYIPDAFYKKLILSVEKDENGTYRGSKDNVITFYYTPGADRAYYAVHYLFEQEDGGGYVESTALTEGIAAVGSQIEIAPAQYSGFTLQSKAELKEGETVREQEITDGKLEMTVSRNGSELYLYYNRNMQSYAVYYLMDGTDITDLSVVPTEAVLAETETGTGKYGTSVTASAKAIAFYNCTSDLTKTMELQSNNKQNVIVFFYTPLSYTVQYQAWHLGGGTFDVTHETRTENFRGSTPTADQGYTFHGWYLDADCTRPAQNLHEVEADTGKLIPNMSNLLPQPKTNIFYAKFMPAFGELKITRNHVRDESAGTQSFVYEIASVADPSFRITTVLTGKDSITIKNLPIGAYTVTQQNDWSWRYEDPVQTVTVEEDEISTAVFGGDAVKESWLNGNSKRIQNRKNKE